MRWRGPAPAEADDQADRLALSARPALAVALTGLALALGGLIVAGPTVAVPGAGLTVLGLLAPAWVLTVLGRLHVDAQAVSRTVTEGQPLSIAITVTGPRRLPRGGATLEHELLPEPVRLPRAGAYEITARARGRGYLAIAPPTVRVEDPVRLTRGSRPARRTVGTLLVLPRTEPVRWLDAAATAAGIGAQGVAAGPHTIDIAGLRDYRAGTPATRIHWPALARGGELLERVFAGESEPAPLLAVDPRLPDPGDDPERLNLVIRAAASLALALSLAGAVDLLLPGRATPLRITATLASWPAGLRALALVPPSPHWAPPPRIPAGDHGTLYYACTDPGFAVAARHRWAGRMLTLSPPLSGTPAAMAMTPAAVPGPAGGTAVLEVAGCVGRPVWSGP